ncbi:hypothetical protein GQX74_002586 [Glossina fuscipes]|nr:hypothetical protein GQX74_002586 [Glossina fuscipes]
MKISFCLWVIKIHIDNRAHIRHIMLYHFEEGWKAGQLLSDLDEIFSEGTIIESRCSEWFVRFKSGDTSLRDKPGRRRPLHLGESWKGMNADRQLQCGPFNHRSSSQKARLHAMLMETATLEHPIYNYYLNMD